MAASVERVPVAVAEALRTVVGLEEGRSEAKETRPVGPVPVEVVETTLPHLPRAIGGMVRLQLLTGMRPAEACMVRGCDLTPGEPTWVYRPATHKNAWRGQKREIPLGPKAQALIREFLSDDMHAYLFDPREAVAAHHAGRASVRKSRPTPSEEVKRAKDPGGSHARKYNRSSYRNAIGRACDRAFPHPLLGKRRRSTLSDAERAELLAWRKEHRWHPNQLRHSAATKFRAECGLDVAQALLGHAKAATTERYAAPDPAKAAQAAAEIG
jgi:integrase